MPQKGVYQVAGRNASRKIRENVQAASGTMMKGRRGGREEDDMYEMEGISGKEFVAKSNV
jgi:hypothetical protein